LPGEINLYELIYNIKNINKKIKIMMILEKEEREIINFLWSQEIYDIFYNNKTLIKEIIEKINNKKHLNENKKKNIKKFLNNKKIIKKIRKFKLKYCRKMRKPININNKLIFVEGGNGTR